MAHLSRWFLCSSAQFGEQGVQWTGIFLKKKDFPHFVIFEILLPIQNSLSLRRLSTVVTFLLGVSFPTLGAFPPSLNFSIQSAVEVHIAVDFLPEYFVVD